MKRKRSVVSTHKGYSRFDVVVAITSPFLFSVLIILSALCIAAGVWNYVIGEVYRQYSTALFVAGGMGLLMAFILAFACIWNWFIDRLNGHPNKESANDILHELNQDDYFDLCIIDDLGNKYDGFCHATKLFYMLKECNEKCGIPDDQCSKRREMREQLQKLVNDNAF